MHPHDIARIQHTFSDLFTSEGVPDPDYNNVTWECRGQGSQYEPVNFEVIISQNTGDDWNCHAFKNGWCFAKTRGSAEKVATLIKCLDIR